MKDFSVLIDYAHNPAGYLAVGEFVKNWKGDRLGVIGGPGDRRDEDLMLLGKIASQIFDHIIIKEDDDNRGRDRGTVADLIAKGIVAENPKASYDVILDETEAIETGLKKVDKGGLVVIFPESVTGSIEMIEKYQSNHN
jgi:cyanophycin synthetase